MAKARKKAKARGSASKAPAPSHRVAPPPDLLDVPLDELADAVEDEAPPGPATKRLSLHPLSAEEALRRAMRPKGSRRKP